MDSQRDQEAASYSEESSLTEVSPLLRPMSENSVASLCTCGVISVLVFCWCLLDYWNRRVSDDLFGIGNVSAYDFSSSSVTVSSPFSNFSYPLTLAWLQFVFMGILFLSMYFSVTQQRPSDLLGLRLSSDRRWPALVVTHVCSTFWLQALMMPSQVMSLGLFAATHALEIPVVAVARTTLLEKRFGKKTLQTTGIAFTASCMLYFSYAELAGCVCILSGNGVALTGMAFWIVYALILSTPAFNAVCQESIMTFSGMHPLLLLALQNILAALIFGPVLITAHLLGWEDVSAAFGMILAYSEVLMMVTWLCAQIALTSVVCAMLIQVTDAFWMVALRTFRVVFWGMIGVLTLSMTTASGVELSILSPRSSFWAFAMVCGCGLAAAAIYTDRRAEDDLSSEKDPFLRGAAQSRSKSSA